MNQADLKITVKLPTVRLAIVWAISNALERVSHSLAYRFWAYWVQKCIRIKP